MPSRYRLSLGALRGYPFSGFQMRATKTLSRQLLTRIGALAVHVDCNLVGDRNAGESLAGELAALTGLEYPGLAMFRQRLLQRLDAEAGLHRDRHAMAGHAPAEPVDGGHEINKAARHRDIGDVPSFNLRLAQTWFGRSAFNPPTDTDGSCGPARVSTCWGGDGSPRSRCLSSAPRHGGGPPGIPLAPICRATSKRPRTAVPDAIRRCGAPAPNPRPKPARVYSGRGP